VLKILADQSQRLASLASDGDAVLEPLARNRSSVTGFFTNARIAGEATAERGEDLELQLEKFPATLREVRLTMTELQEFADQGTPLMEDVGTAAPYLSKATQKLAPFARNAIPAFETLGDAAETSGPKLVASDPLLVQLRELGKKSGPSSEALEDLLVTFAKTDGFKYLMDFIYYSTAGINGFDTFGHFLRAQVQLTSCLEFELAVFSGCEAVFVRTQAQENKGKKKKKKKKKKSNASGLRSAPRQPPPAPAAPDGPVPPIEDLIPELDPGDGDEETPTETTPAEPAGPDGDAQPPADTDDATANAAARAAQGELAEQLDMQDASMLLRYLLGSES
jgi:hypothetical protein